MRLGRAVATGIAEESPQEREAERSCTPPRDVETVPEPAPAAAEPAPVLDEVPAGR
ncbi:hypothetical protein GPA10_19560 [Streptomyces sp. p1417]|uniref:Uncharacterized protein n=1 Tax=Streptomyces typhae TaxID=2681492 RepID=A0A6L6WZC9_9ACTN|nr:hypothetical protein [Streptomyces typhae]MVO86895.1 hypothetical protein [Streptomyces typhae]